MQKEFEFIICKLHELLAVEQLEYHNKTWLSGSEASRSEQKQDDLKYLINRLNTLALDVAGNRPSDKIPSEDANGCWMQSLKMRQG
jgi:hypothetical protein